MAVVVVMLQFTKLECIGKQPSKLNTIHHAAQYQIYWVAMLNAIHPYNIKIY